MKYKKFLTAVTFLSILITANAGSIGALEREYSWYCIRSGKSQPPITEEEKLLCSYGGYSIDRHVNDSSKEKVIYLTFDCGYINENVESILDTMKKEGIESAFFLLDNPILKNPQTVKRMAAEGHLICNHTKNHKNICSYTKEEIKSNLSELEQLCKEKTNIEMQRYFRFPEGRYSISALKNISELSYIPIFWSFAYDDWDNDRQMNSEVAKKKILDNTHNGAIFLFHPTSRVNAEIFPTLIKEWKTAGYRFGTLDEL